jgi:hypothetical protein
VDIDSVINFVLVTLTLVVGWLWRLITSNSSIIYENHNNLALLKQSHDNQRGRVNGMEEKVQKLSDEITEVKFSIQSLEHKQDKHHLELLNEIRTMTTKQ